MIDGQTYRAASREHMTASRELYEQGRYVLSHYVAGLAVECILRAYRVRLGREFSERHDLYELSKSANFLEVVPPRRVEAVTAALGVVFAQWSNDHRYRSEESLRRWLVRLRLYQGIKGDFVKERTRRIVDAATEVVSIGVERWTN